VELNPGPHDGEPPASGPVLRLVLELTVGDGEAASGTVRLAAGSPPIGFHGWIGLMSAISDLCAGTVPGPVSTDAR
jgi:hypothetical protein